MEKGAVLLSTIVGAAVGGLGANAVERRLERRNGREEEWGARRKELEGKVRDAEGDVRRERRDWDDDNKRKGGARGY
ncbi:hypothetical protein QBC42DRAFT_267890 [Cladorrhinum samala]|uniref:Uncharacterized protein n=1 Tax=Cladorrhinum samala TaxID=585594 RepID=A0AAV9HQZ8_9PEZI|nr:hypothetical protein QBC42DRAFT_267890 [Cladorrhinum samala]